MTQWCVKGGETWRWRRIWKDWGERRLGAGRDQAVTQTDDQLTDAETLRETRLRGDWRGREVGVKVDRSQYPDPKSAGYYLLQDIRNPVSLLPEPEPDTGYRISGGSVFCYKDLAVQNFHCSRFFFLLHLVQSYTLGSQAQWKAKRLVRSSSSVSTVNAKLIIEYDLSVIASLLMFSVWKWENPSRPRFFVTIQNVHSILSFLLL